MRKSPIKHHVRSHTRVGVRVHDYERGSGHRPAKPTLSHFQSSSKFSVTIKYLDESANERYQITAPNFETAIFNAMDQRRNISTPTVVEATMI